MPATNLGGMGTLEPLDRTSRISTLFRHVGKRLRNFIDPNYLLI